MGIRREKAKKILIITLIVYLYLFLGLTRFKELMAYVIPTICWTFPILITLYITGFKNIHQWSNNQATTTAILTAALQLSALIGISFFTSFGKSPYVHTPTTIFLYIAYFASPLTAFELSRALLIKSCPKRKIFTGMALTALFYTFISFPLTKYLTFGAPAETIKFIGSDLLPTLAQSLLATYLALLGGPIASIAYLGTLQAFEWLSPILPNPPWTIKALITTLIPTIGFLTVTQTISQFTLMRYGIITRKEVKRRPHISKKPLPSLSWTAIALIAVILLWGSTGLLGFQPNVIASGSMKPTLDIGDIAITIPTPAQKIQIGDIIQYRRPGETAPTIHRVIEISQAGGVIYITTKGDANTAPDEPITIPLTQTIGKLTLTIPKLGWISIYLKEFAANAYTFITTTLPNTITESGALALKNGVYITTALTLTAFSCLLLTYRNYKTKKEEKMNRRYSQH